MYDCAVRGSSGDRNRGAAAPGVGGRAKSKLELLMEQEKAKKAAVQARQAAQAAAQPAAQNGGRQALSECSSVSLEASRLWCGVQTYWMRRSVAVSYILLAIWAPTESGWPATVVKVHGDRVAHRVWDAASLRRFQLRS